MSSSRSFDRFENDLETCAGQQNKRRRVEEHVIRVKREDDGLEHIDTNWSGLNASTRNSLSSISDVAADNIYSSVNLNNSITPSSSGSPESRDGLSYSGSAAETPTTDLGYPLKGSPAVMLENTPKIEGIRLAVALDIIRSAPHATLLELNQHYKDLHDACTRTRGAYDIVHNAYLTLRDAYNLVLVECNTVQDKYRQAKSAYIELARTAPYAIPLTSNPFHTQVHESAELPPWPAPASSQSTPSSSLLSGSVPIPSHTTQPSSLSSTSAVPASKEPVKPKLADSSALLPSSKSIAESSQSAQQKPAVSSLLPSPQSPAELRESDYPKLQFWSRSYWTSFAQNGPRYSEGKTPEGVPRYLEDENGEPVSRERVNSMRRHQRAIFFQMKHDGTAPRTWGKISGEAAKFHQVTMCAAFPELAYCEWGWKTTALAQMCYSNWWHSYMSPRNAGKKDGRRKKGSLSSTSARVAKPELRSPSLSALVSSENKVPLDQSHAVDSNPISAALDTTAADNSGTTCQLRFNTSFHPWRFPSPSPDNANQG